MFFGLLAAFAFSTTVIKTCIDDNEASVTEKRKKDYEDQIKKLIKSPNVKKENVGIFHNPKDKTSAREPKEVKQDAKFYGLLSNIIKNENKY